MVQCYSGGFANLIFEQGQPDKPLAKANRCGFFATVHDRIAAGCTSDIDEEDYHEYSSAFWAAISRARANGQSSAAAGFRPRRHRLLRRGTRLRPADVQTRSTSP